MYKYVHPGTIKQGYLTKSPPLEKRGLKKWKKRWCIFSRANGEEPWLNYYRTEEDAFNILAIKRVNLKHCFKVELDLVHSSHKNIFTIHMPGRVYYFSAPSQIEMSEWADTLCSHLNLTSSEVVVQPHPLYCTPPINHKYGETKPRSSTLPSETRYSTRVETIPAEPFYKVPTETYYNTGTGHLTAECYYNSSKTGHLPAESYYSSSPNFNRRLPKPPDSPLPPIPDERTSNPSTSPSRSPSRSPIPPPHASVPRLTSASPHSPTHSSPVPPVPYHSSRSLSPTHLAPLLPVPSHSAHRPPSPTHTLVPPVSSRSSPHLSSHQSHMTPPPIPHPRPHSPSSDSNARQPNSALGSRDRISFRPPAPPPKVTEDTNSTGSCDDLGEAPPTPPPRPRDKATFSPASESTSSSDSEFDLPPPLPPRPHESV